jgi:hypothetical protein
MLTRLRLLAFSGLLVMGLLAVPFSAAAAQPAAAALTVPVTGSTGSGGTFNGAYTIQRFATQGSNLVAIGTLTGTVTDAAGTAVGTVTDVPVTIPVAAATGSCTILDLTLGPLDLNLLGLMVHLNTVHLTITAQSGSGNLLGNLLCAVAHLLDGNPPLGTLAGLLNRILPLI